MELNGISGGQPRIPQRVLTENVIPALAQSVLPQDTLGIQTKREPSKGLSANARLSDLKPEQLSSLGGGSALQTIAEAQPGTTVGEVGPLLRNQAALDSIAGLMQNRRDLKVGDFVSQDEKGRVRIDPSYKDDKTMELLKERPDITPGEVTAMRQDLTKTLKSPEMGKEAAEKSFELMKKRPDLKPEDMGNLMNSMRGAVGGDKKNGGGDSNDQAGSAAALDMFDKAANLMTKRTDLKPERMGDLARQVGNLSSPEDRNGPQNIAESFEAASKGLEKNVLRTPEEMGRMASTMGEHFQGGDEKSAGARMNAFKKGAGMMADNNQVDHNSLNKMLTQATERDPKIKNGEGAKRNQRLGKVMDDVSTGVKQGTVSATDLSSHFRNQDAEKARFQKTEPKKQDEKKPGQADEQKPKSEEGKGKPETAQGKPETGQPKAGEEKGKPEAKTPPAPEEEGAKPPSEPGAAPHVDPAEGANMKPGEAAGTSSAGVAPGTTPKPAKGGQAPTGGQGGASGVIPGAPGGPQGKK